VSVYTNTLTFKSSGHSVIYLFYMKHDRKDIYLIMLQKISVLLDFQFTE